MCKYYAFALLFLAGIASCKKDTKTEEQVPAPVTGQPALNCDSNTTKFSLDLHTTQSFFDVAEDAGGNVLLLGATDLFKYDYKGNLLWKKPVAFTGTPQHIFCAGGAYFVATATMDIEPYQAGKAYAVSHPAGQDFSLLSYWKQNPYIFDNCAPAFQHIQKSFNDSPDVFTLIDHMPANNSHCFLYKLDQDGNQLWMKTFSGNYFNARSMCAAGDGNLYLLTYKLSGLYNEMKFDTNGVFQDTVFLPMDKNSVVLNKIDQDGQVLWQKEYAGILQPNQVPPYELNAQVCVFGQHIFILTWKDLLVADAGGNEIKRMKAFGNDCAAGPSGMQAGTDGVYLTGSLSGGKGFVQLMDEQAAIKWSVNDGMYLQHAGIRFLNSGFVQFTESAIKKFNAPGSVSWIKTFPTPQMIYGITTTCKDGVICVYRDHDATFLIKTDKDGN